MAASFDEKWADFEAEVGPALSAEMSVQAPVDTGQLAANQDWRDDNGRLEVYTIDNRGPIAVYVIRGTAPHAIDPVRAKMLHWVNRDGAHVFARHVDHPGTLPNPYNVAAWEAQRDYVVGAFARKVALGYALAYLNPWRARVI